MANILPETPRAYAWAYETDSPKKPRHVTVLHMGLSLRLYRLCGLQS